MTYEKRICKGACDELSNDAKQKAIIDSRKYLELYGYAWEDENNRAIESIAKA